MCDFKLDKSKSVPFGLEAVKDLKELQNITLFEKIWCVYFLILGPNIQYIGSTPYLQYRIHTHLIQKTCQFNRVLFFLTKQSEDFTKKVEQSCIRYFKPPVNRLGNGVRRPCSLIDFTLLSNYFMNITEPKLIFK